ncbi:MAG TPA: hypothetical protein PK082_04325 [Phycisphaerae bacterium]|nr:hypothetical protein [Phycisphaerae bacterium]
MNHHANKTSAAARAARGMTLIELIVAVGILAGMILGFSMILTQTQKVVVGSQSMMRSNAAAAGIAQVIRQDFSRASKSGFLYLSEDKIVFTISGVCPSLTGSSLGTGSAVWYALCDRAGYAGEKVFLRQGYVLDRGAAATAGDTIKRDYQELVSGTFANIVNRVEMTEAFFPNPPTPVSLAVPPGNLAGIGEMWRVLAVSVSNVKFFWTDGATDGGGNLYWYGNGQPKPGVQAYEQEIPYKACWTHHDMNAWPRAIKIQFQINDETMPDEFQNYPYEVICTVGG